MKVELVGVYGGNERWAIARFPMDKNDPRGPYRIGTFVQDGLSFMERPFGSREDAEAWLFYSLDGKVEL